MDGAKDGAEGKLTYKIEEKGQGRFRDLAHNINNMKETDRGNVDLRNDVNMKNTDIYNKQQDSNVQSAKDIYANDENKVALRTGQYGGNKEDIRKRQEQNQQMIGNLGTAIGSALSSSK